MTKLNQVIAVSNGKKTQAEAALTEIYHKLQKPELFNGLLRRYTPSDDEGETLPSEEKLPQAKVKDAITSAKQVLTELIDIVGTQDYANTTAVGSIIVDDKIVIADVPVTTLLFLEKTVENIKTLISKLPTLDPAERWEFDSTSDCYKTKAVVTNRNVKKLRNHIKFAATPQHPAQVDVYNEDVKVGTWENTKFSTCIDVQRRNELMNRVRKLSEAIKFAREAANSIEVEKQEYADDLLQYVFQ